MGLSSRAMAGSVNPVGLANKVQLNERRMVTALVNRQPDAALASATCYVNDLGNESVRAAESALGIAR